MLKESWNRQVWRLAGPIILSNISVPLLGAVDTAVVGHLPGPHYIGAVAIGAVVFSFVYWGFGFLRMGTTGLTAQALGAENHEEVRASLLRALLIGAVLGSGLVILQAPIAWGAFTLMEASSNVEPLAREYFFIRIWGAPAVLANYAILGWFLGIRNTRAALYVQVAMNGTNMVLDVIFVFGFGWGVGGVALATLISEVGAVFFGLWLIRRNARTLAGHWALADAIRAEPIRRMLAVNGDIFIRTLCLISAFAIFTSIGARSGDRILAANAVLLNFQTFMAYALDGFAHAAEALTGGAVGARKRDAFRQAVKATSRWAFYFAAAFVLVYAGAGPLLINALTDIPEVRETALTYLPWAVISPMVSVWSFQLDGIFLGATRSKVLRNAMVFSVAVYIAALFVLVPQLGNHGLWLSLMVLMVARALSLGLFYPALERSVEQQSPAVSS